MQTQVIIIVVVGGGGGVRGWEGGVGNVHEVLACVAVSFAPNFHDEPNILDQ